MRQASTNSCEGSEDQDCCWICLESSGYLSRPCMCPRMVHSACLARWQLQQAGKTEERSCRFCNGSLPDWKLAVPAASGCGSAPAATAASGAEPVMVVTLGGQCVKLRVKPGPEGMAEFRHRVRELFGIPPGVEFECSFKCRAPSGDIIKLDGLQSYEAATHCASLTAAQRAARRQHRPATPSSHGHPHPHVHHPHPHTDLPVHAAA